MPADTADRAWRVPDGTRVYAIGDIHGRADLLERLHAKIAADAADAPARRVAVYIGDYIDRGPRSAEVIDAILAEPLAGFETVRLMGNHERLMLDFLDGRAERAPAWLMNGGDATFRSYGMEPPDAGAERSFAAAATELAHRVPDAHRRFFDSLEISHREGDYLFVHAGVRPGVAIADQSDRDLIWIRDEFLTSDEDFGCRVVHGHTVMAAPQLTANRVSIDTGAFATGVLTAAALEGAEVRFLSA